jgi:cyanophycin synthetase
MRILSVRAIHGPNVVSGNPVVVMRLDVEDARGDAALAVEQAVLELSGYTRAKTIAVGPPNLYDVCVEFEFESEPGMKRLFEIAVESVDALMSGRPYPLEERLVEAREIVRDSDLDPSARAIVDAAAKRGIPWSRLGDDSMVQLGYGRHRKLIQAAMGSQTSAIAASAAADKPLTKALLARAGVPAATGRVVRSPEDAAAALEEIGPPVAMKPLATNQGKGVSLDLWTPEQATFAYEIASTVSKRVMVEQMLSGRDYRVLVVKGRMVAACERIPARITGDGTSTVQELIAHSNRDRHGRVDRGCLAALGKQGFQLDSIPPEGFAVQLRGDADLSIGGAAIDVTDRVHPSVALICERAARAIGLDICGVDLVVCDIAAPFTDGGVVALHAAPDLRMHHHPSEGEPRDVAAEIVRMLYPEGNARIPIVSTDTAASLIAHILEAPACRVGIATSEGPSAATVLFDPDVDLAVIEVSRDGVLRDGLGYDWSDVAVITGGPDKRIASLIADRVREGGTLVLNADKQLPRKAQAGRNVVWFARDASNPILKEAQRKGATVYYVDEGQIHEAVGQSRRRIMNLADVPSVPVADVMAAVAACRALGAGVAQSRAGLRSFQPGQPNPAAKLLEFGARTAPA